MNPIN